METTFRPLQPGAWGKPYTPVGSRRSRYTFKASWADTIDRLDHEIAQLGAKGYVIEADFREQDIRLDGLPRANARQPEFPGIRVSFESKHGPLQYQSDICDFWQHNVRSIALGLEALRAVDRFGISSRAEQYTGFKALEGPKAMSRDEAIALLQKVSQLEPADKWLFDLHWRKARVRAHPDRNNGDHALWYQVEEAGKVLGLL